MRLIKVQLTNLKSLAGTWTIDFEHPDYQSSGLFLITGPTGAGKTTLLDSICLALYGKTPLCTFSGERNELMTRDTWHCSAEVTFETPKGRFRATWGQHRANKNSQGALQQITHELARADGTVLSSVATATKELIKEIAGIDFSQFTQAVMLAQNSFDKFLRADDMEKSSILEKLTDTSIYSELSRLAHVKCTEKNKDLDKLLEQTKGCAPLSEEERNFKIARIDEIDQKTVILENEIKTQNLLLAAIDRANTLIREKNQINQEMQALTLEQENFAPFLEQLAMSKKAAAAESFYQAAIKLRNDLQLTQSSLAVEQEKLQKTVTELEIVKDKFERSTQENSEHSEKMIKMGQILARADALDGQIADKERQILKDEGENRELQIKLAANAKNLTQLSGELQNLQARYAKVDEWLTNKAHDEWLETNLSSFRIKTAQLAEYEKEVEKLQIQYEKDKKALSGFQSDLNETDKRLQELNRKMTESTAILEDLNNRRDLLLAGHGLEELKTACQEKILLADRYKSFADHRRELKPEEPCPLCGSLHHPWTEDEDKEISTLEIRINDLQKQIRDVEELNPAIAKMEQEQSKHNIEIAKFTEGQNRLATIIQNQRETCNQAAARLDEIKTRHENLSAELLSELKPLNMPENLSFEASMQLLQKRLQDLQNHRKEKESLVNKIHNHEAELIKIKAEQDNLQILVKKLVSDGMQRKEEKEILAKERMLLLPDMSVEAARRKLAEKGNSLKKMLESATAIYTSLKTSRDNAAGSIATLQEHVARLSLDSARTEEELREVLASRGLTEVTFLQARMEAGKIEELEARKLGLAQKKAALEARQKANSRACEEEITPALENLDKAGIEQKLQTLKIENKNLFADRTLCDEELRRDKENIKKLAEYNKLITAAKKELKRWEALDKKIGSADGKLFRSFAQGITLDRLLMYANRQLAVINPRYALKRVIKKNLSDKNPNLDLEIIDNYQAGNVRSIDTLSGGETFMASLALALGLSEMAGKNTSLGTLFLDEGFGSLDYDSLETAFAAISKLRKENQLIGIISHVEALKEWIPNQIAVSRNPANITISTISGSGCSGKSA